MYLASWLLSFGTLSLVSGAANPPVGPSLQKILDKAYKSPLYSYPTSLTQGIIPKFIHSHNDYWRKLPFYSALSVGCVSIEADVWLVNGSLLVGHEESALTAERTLESLYIEPILESLNSSNPRTAYADPDSRNGVYDTAADQTLYLFVDMKTNGEKTYPVVLEALKPLRDGGWLTTAEGDSYTEGTVTVIGTGNTPQDLVVAENPRDLFFDGPLATLADTNVTRAISPIASTSFQSVVGEFKGTELNDTQLEAIREQITTAHERDIMVRYWETPGWPTSTRNAVWRTLWTEGTDLINADDLEAAAGFSGAAGNW